MAVRGAARDAGASTEKKSLSGQGSGPTLGVAGPSLEGAGVGAGAGVQRELGAAMSLPQSGQEVRPHLTECQ